MFLNRKSSARLAVAALALFAMKVSVAMAADLTSSKDVAPVVVEDPRWYVRVGATGVFYSGSAKLNAFGAPIPGATATLPNNATVTFDAGYFILPNIAIQATGGVPVIATVNGAGTVSGLGTLGKASIGPAILSVNYVYKDLGPLQPYVGVGGGYSIIFRTLDRYVKNLNVEGNFGFVVQGGVEYRLNRNWGVYVDAKHIWLSVNANGLGAGVVPVTAKVTLDPTVVSAGIAYHW